MIEQVILTREEYLALKAKADENTKQAPYFWDSFREAFYSSVKTMGGSSLFIKQLCETLTSINGGVEVRVYSFNPHDAGLPTDRDKK